MPHAGRPGQGVLARTPHMNICGWEERGEFCTSRQWGRANIPYVGGMRDGVSEATPFLA